MQGKCLGAILLASTVLTSTCYGQFGFVEDFVEQRKKDVENGVDAGKKAAEGAIEEAKKGLNEAGKTVDDAGKQAIDTAKKSLDDLKANVEKSFSDLGNTAAKAFDDAVWNARKAVIDTVDATAAAARFVEREIKGYRDSLSDAERRVREGKVVDAVWHLSTDHYANSEENAAKLAQENELANAAMSAAATAYGGPAGASAYAAWYAYKQTGNVETALRVGAIAGLQSAAVPNATAMPSGTVGEVAKKAVVTGAIGGVAVAAAGGDQAAVEQAFIRQGGMVVVQSGQNYISKTYDANKAEIDSQCMSTFGGQCSVVIDNIRRDKNGNISINDDGLPDTLKEKIVYGRETLGQFDKIKQDIAAGQRKLNMLSTTDWSISWNRALLEDKYTRLPAITLTYTGKGSPFEAKFKAYNDASKHRKQLVEPTAPAETMPGDKVPEAAGLWVAASDIGSPSSFFARVFPKGDALKPKVGDVLKSKLSINVRKKPADWSGSKILGNGRIVVVTDVRSLTSPVGAQDWLKIELADGKAL